MPFKKRALILKFEMPAYPLLNYINDSSFEGQKLLKILYFGSHDNHSGRHLQKGF